MVSVSYTHLDVYKRQPVHLSTSIGHKNRRSVEGQMINVKLSDRKRNEWVQNNERLHTTSSVLYEVENLKKRETTVLMGQR